MWPSGWSSTTPFCTGTSRARRPCSSWPSATRWARRPSWLPWCHYVPRKPAASLELLRSWFAVHATFPALRAALKRGPGEDASEELAGIIDELYGFVERNRLLLLLIESLVIDYPEFSALRVSDSKRSHIGGLAAFLSSRASAGGLRPLSDPEIAAHFLAESVAWFAQHRKADPSLALIDDERARVSVRELLLSAFVPDTRPTGTGPEPTSRGQARPADRPPASSLS